MERMSAEKVVEVRGVSKRFGRTQAVSDVSFDLGPGEALGLVGPNGAGKTTTLRMLATLLAPDSGEIQVLGKSIADPFEVRPFIGFMPDVLGVYPEMLIKEYLEFFARAYDIEDRLIGYRIGEVVEFAGLGELLEKPAAGLSRGQLQRVALARALLHDPPLLLLDEPAAGLDPRSRVDFRHMVLALLKKGKSAIISSHVLADLEDMCGRIAVIERGRLMICESTDVFLEKARSARTYRVRVAPSSEGGDVERAHALLKERAEVQNLRYENEDLLFDIGRENGIAARLLRHLMDAGLEIDNFAEVQFSLEEAYLLRTGSPSPGEGLGAGAIGGKA
jgi:ABC-2 type transport system ATP-binding protein